MKNLKGIIVLFIVVFVGLFLISCSKERESKEVEASIFEAKPITINQEEKEVIKQESKKEVSNVIFKQEETKKKEEKEIVVDLLSLILMLKKMAKPMKLLLKVQLIFLYI